jgi:hypothetical protein
VATGAEIKPAFGDFHPDLPLWAKNHFIEWIRMLRCGRDDSRDILRGTGIVGIETGIMRPEDLTLLMRVIELRGSEGEGNLTGKKRKRTRKERNSWNWVIRKLVDEQACPVEITYDASKKPQNNLAVV